MPEEDDGFDVQCPDGLHNEIREMPNAELEQSNRAAPAVVGQVDGIRLQVVVLGNGGKSRQVLFRTSAETVQSHRRQTGGRPENSDVHGSSAADRHSEVLHRPGSIATWII